MLGEVGLYTLNKLLVHCQPGHLAAAHGLAVDDPALAMQRARYVRKLLEVDAARRG